MTEIDYICLAYLSLVTLIGVILTVRDKRAARKKKRRIPERTLLWCGVFGGALGMWLTMLYIRHKTKKKRFMLGLPLLVVWHLLVAFCFYYLGI
jgi:uncharacterized membrane protein YsdA (DUF1294 family)